MLDKHVYCSGENLTHLRDLVIPPFNAFLIDAHRIDPDLARVIAGKLKRFCRMLKSLPLTRMSSHDRGESHLYETDIRSTVGCCTRDVVLNVAHCRQGRINLNKAHRRDCDIDGLMLGLGVLRHGFFVPCLPLHITSQNLWMS